MNTHAIPFDFATFDAKEMSRTNSAGAAFRAEQAVNIYTLNGKETVVQLISGEAVYLSMPIEQVLVRIEVAEDKTLEKSKALNLDFSKRIVI